MCLWRQLCVWRKIFFSFRMRIGLVFAWMENTGKFRWKFLLLFVIVFVLIFIIMVRTPRTHLSIPQPRGHKKTCPSQISELTITPLRDTKHLLMSAYEDQRVKDFDIRIIGIFRRDSIQTLYCVFCCAGHLSIRVPANILVHEDHFGFVFGATDVMCKIPETCNATHVNLLTQADNEKTLIQSWLPIRKQKTWKEENKINFTVCISSLYGNYNNALQYAQTLEMYRLLGVGRVVIYNTSCGPELNRLLQSYIQEDFVEVISWPIDKHLKPSPGWHVTRDGGELHYYGQLTTHNECILRCMDRSRYVLLNDIDEIIMPYQHNNLTSLMYELQPQHPNTGVFLIENHIFPKNPFDEIKRLPLPLWNGVPGFNILQHIYREERDKNDFQPYKMIIQPRLVEQTSVHRVIKTFGNTYPIPPNVCRIIHSPIYTPYKVPLEKLHVDTRLWDFKDQLLPRVNKVLRRAGLLTS